MVDCTSVNPLALPCLNLSNKKDLPECSAVYFLIHENSTVVYVGKTLNIQRRWRSHHLLNQFKRCRVEYSIAWYECDNINLLSSLETDLIKLLQPKFNEQLGRKPENRTVLLTRVNTNTPEKLKAIAKALGYLYDEEGSTGKLLDAIASGEVLLVSTKTQN